MSSHHCSEGKVSPLQDAQMAIENLEEFLEKSPIRISAREEVKKRTSILRENLKIPKEKIYCDLFYFPYEEEEREKMFKILGEQLRSFNKGKDSEKTETTIAHPPKPDYSYNPPKEILEKARNIFIEMENILNDSLFATELSKKDYDSIINLVKEKVLKLN